MRQVVKSHFFSPSPLLLLHNKGFEHAVYAFFSWPRLIFLSLPFLWDGANEIVALFSTCGKSSKCVCLLHVTVEVVVVESVVVVVESAE